MKALMAGEDDAVEEAAANLAEVFASMGSEVWKEGGREGGKGGREGWWRVAGERTRSFEGIFNISKHTLTVHLNISLCTTQTTNSSSDRWTTQKRWRRPARTSWRTRYVPLKKRRKEGGRVAKLQALMTYIFLYISNQLSFFFSFCRIGSTRLKTQTFGRLPLTLTSGRTSCGRTPASCTARRTIRRRTSFR